jgi:hypothetical protein
MWAAMTRSLEMIVALFEYYTANSVVPPTEALQEEPAPSNVNDIR